MATLKVNNGAWVFIGDGTKALLLTNEGDAEILNLRRREVREQPSAQTHDQGTDAPGRAYSPVGSRHGSVEQTDWHRLEEDRFAATVTAELNKASYENAFKELVIVAPPKTLAEIRRDLSRDAHRKVVAEIPKDLVHHTIPNIETLLASYDIG